MVIVQSQLSRLSKYSVCFLRFYPELAFNCTKVTLSYGYANLVALTMLDRQSAAPAGEDDLVTQQYAGAKANLRPVYDALIEQIHSFGEDVEIAPKKAYVSVRRNRQFAILQPSTVSRLGVGINLKGSATTERLEASGSFNSMVSHRVRVASLAEIDSELVEWLRLAYSLA